MNAVDTNILLYARDRSDLRKNAIAKHVIRQTEGGPLLWQVAVEFIAACRRLEYRGFTPTMAWSRLHQFARVYRLVLPTHDCLARARHLHIENGYSFWDALIIAACLDAGVTRLYSEDLPGRTPPPGLQIVSPFA